MNISGSQLDMVTFPKVPKGTSLSIFSFISIKLKVFEQGAGRGITRKTVCPGIGNFRGTLFRMLFKEASLIYVDNFFSRKHLVSFG